MVRFIIRYTQYDKASYVYLYIPIWLDLLSYQDTKNILQMFNFTFQYGQIYYTDTTAATYNNRIIFTFQYGQIYYTQFKDLQQTIKLPLHSNMVRFIIVRMHLTQYNLKVLYIPIWLDLLIKQSMISKSKAEALHSNMVRFIIHIGTK